MKQKAPIHEDPEFYDFALTMTRLFSTGDGKKFVEWVEKNKMKALEKIVANPSDINVAAVEKKDDGITIVVLNKDENKYDLDSWAELQRYFERWRIEATGIKGE